MNDKMSLRALLLSSAILSGYLNCAHNQQEEKSLAPCQTILAMGDYRTLENYKIEKYDTNCDSKVDAVFYKRPKLMLEREAHNYPMLYWNDKNLDGLFSDGEFLYDEKEDGLNGNEVNAEDFPYLVKDFIRDFKVEWFFKKQ